MLAGFESAPATNTAKDKFPVVPQPQTAVDQSKPMKKNAAF
jgi:hypothetical protein